MSYPGNDGRQSPVRPLLEGDKIGYRKVAGFAWTPPPPGHRSTHLDDRLLLDGEEQLTVPPDRPVPLTADRAVAAAPMPPDDLSDRRRLRPATAVNRDMPARADGLLDLAGARWQPMIRPLFATVHGTGHRIWLAGGAARDVVAGTPPEEVNDLDLSGTVPAGRFSDLAYQALRASRMSECRTTVTPHSLVCAVVPPGDTTRIIEYRGLTRGGFAFPAVGSRLVADAEHRDFSFNALLYDVMEHEIFDPDGRGVDDLLQPRRRFRPLSHTADPFRLAGIVVRALKFGTRWEGDLDLDLLLGWIAGLPADLWESLTEPNWESLRKEAAKIEASLDQKLDFAAQLPRTGRVLLEALIGGAR
jgi:hypothetical protein